METGITRLLPGLLLIDIDFEYVVAWLLNYAANIIAVIDKIAIS